MRGSASRAILGVALNEAGGRAALLDAKLLANSAHGILGTLDKRREDIGS